MAVKSEAINVEVPQESCISGIEIQQSSVVSGIELVQELAKETISNERGACWSYNVSDQFPIETIRIRKGSEYIEVKSPHEGYKIKTTLKLWRMNGKSFIYSNKGVLVAILYFVNGVATGPCTLYDADGLLYFKGFFENGNRQGRGKEYDKDGKMVFDGFYEKGKRRNITPYKGKSGYWQEEDNTQRVIRICKLNDTGRYEGKCYSYNNGKIEKVSKYKNGNEIAVLKQFINGKMVEYKHGKKRYMGDFLDSLESDYVRHGKGEEFGNDGETKTFQGNYKYGKRYGTGISYRKGKARKEKKWINGHMDTCFYIYPVLTIICILLIISSLIIDLYVGTAVLIIALVFHLLRWTLVSCYGANICSSETLDWIADISWEDKLDTYNYDNTCVAKLKKLCVNFMKNIYLSVAILLVVSIVGIVAYIAMYNKFVSPYVSIVKTSFIVESNRFNEAKSLKITNRPFLKMIKIEDNSLIAARSLYVKGLKSLTTLTIGSNSFTEHPNSFGNDNSKSFHISNCDKLESIIIGEYSFSDFGGEFKLINLPELQNLQIGNLHSDSYNFYTSACTMGGI